MKNFDFEKDKRVKTYFHTPILAIYMTNERLQGEKQFCSMRQLLEMLRSPTKICLKSAPQKLKVSQGNGIVQYVQNYKHHEDDQSHSKKLL